SLAESGQLFQQLGEFLTDARRADDVGGRRVGAQAAKFPAGLDIGEHKCGDKIAISAGKNHVANEGSKMIDKAGAQRSDADPCARGKLEILRYPAVEQQSFAWIVRVNEFQRVADLVETLFIERVARQIVLPPVSGRDV